MRAGWLYTDERAWRAAPRRWLGLLALALLLHMALKWREGPPLATASALSPPLPVSMLRLASAGEPQSASQLSSLYLQAFDNQPGVSIPFAALDYARVESWLRSALALDGEAQYPLMMASQLYGQVNDAAKQRAMCEFVHREFLTRPNQRWRWLAHCAIMARHRLKDMPLALQWAEDIARHAGAASSWARQMRIFFLEDMGEVERAAVLLGGLLESKTISDAYEMHFLMERFTQLKQMGAGNSAPAAKSR